MNTTDKHQALRRALTPEEPVRLPSNFAFTTLRRIREEQRKAERRQQVAALVTVAAISVAGLSVLAFFYGAALWQSLSNTVREPEGLALVLPTLFCLAFFVLANHLLARRYRQT